MRTKVIKGVFEDPEWLTDGNSPRRHTLQTRYSGHFDRGTGLDPERPAG